MDIALPFYPIEIVAEELNCSAKELIKQALKGKLRLHILLEEGDLFEYCEEDTKVPWVMGRIGVIGEEYFCGGYAVLLPRTLESLFANDGGLLEYFGIEHPDDKKLRYYSIKGVRSHISIKQVIILDEVYEAYKKSKPQTKKIESRNKKLNDAAIEIYINHFKKGEKPTQKEVAKQLLDKFPDMTASTIERELTTKVNKREARESFRE